MLLIFAIVVIIIVGGLIVGSMHTSQQSPQFPITNATVPSQFSQLATPSPNTDALKTISSLASSSIQRTSQLYISYGGTLFVKPSGLLGDAVNVNSPIYVKYYKDGKAAKLDINVTSVSVLGHSEITYVNNSGSTYLCSNLNTSAIQKANPSKILTGSITCANATTLLGIDLQSLSNFNLSSLTGSYIQANGTYVGSIRFVPNTVYESDYHNMSCTFISGNILYNAQNGTSSNDGAFQTCVSNEYQLPLSWSMGIQDSQGTFAAYLNETGLSNATTQAQATSLPGPVT